MQFDFRITKQDYISYNLHTLDATNAGKSALMKYRIAIFVLLAIFVAVPELLIKDTLFRIIYAVVMLAFMIYSQLRAKKDYRKTITKTLEKTNTVGYYDSLGKYNFLEDGIRVESGEDKVSLDYSEIKKVCFFEDMIIIYYDDSEGFMMPNSCFKGLSQKREFFEFMKAHCPGAEAAVIENSDVKKNKTKD